MSRHRNFRNYSYEDDMSDDVYGHSVEDYDMAISPSTAAQFMYRRTNSRDASELGHYIGCVVEEEEDESEEDDHPQNSQDYKRPQLDPISEAKLSSCLDQLHSILGETCHEPTAIQAVLKCNFDIEKALDDILNEGNKKDTKAAVKPSSSKGQSVVPPQNVTAFTPVKKREIELKTPPRKVSSSKDKLKVGFSTPTLDKSTDQSSPERAKSTESDLSKSPEVARPKTKVKDQIDKKAEVERREKGKVLLNLVVIGHVDAGKSTLMGHLLFLLGDVSKKAMHKYETESKKAGKASFAFAWVLDETGEERERGITMDVGLTKFETKTKVITLMDAPGHKDFIPNMITGAAQADAAILVVDASTGEFEAGFEAGGQTREHALLVRSLGVTQMIVAVNKLDNVDWSQERYNHIVGKMKAFLKQAGFKTDSDVAYLPCSGLSGENLASTPKDSKLKSWYNGPCLVDRIDQFKQPIRPLEKPLRFCVSDVYKGMGAGINVMGKLEAGVAQAGEKILVMPAGEQGLIKGITVHDEVAPCACAGDHVNITLGGIDMMHVGVGSILCDPSSPIRATTRLKARIIVFNIEIPITKGFMVLFHYQALSEPAVIKRLLSVLHKSTGEVIQRKPRCLTKNANAEVLIQTSRPVCVEIYKEFKDLGRFMLRYGGNTIAAGVVTEILS